MRDEDREQIASFTPEAAIQMGEEIAAYFEFPAQVKQGMASFLAGFTLTMQSLMDGECKDCHCDVCDSLRGSLEGSIAIAERMIDDGC